MSGTTYNGQKGGAVSEVNLPEDIELLINPIASSGRKVYKKTLENLVTSNETFLSEEYRKAVLLQIGHCILRLHRKNLAWPSHPLLSPSHIWLTIEEIGQTFKIPSDNKDIKCLAGIYLSLLTNVSSFSIDELPKDYNKYKCSDPDIAIDLLEKIKNGEIRDMEEVLKHPFHWSDREKIYFICNIYEMINRNSTIGASSDQRWKIEEDKESVLPTVESTKQGQSVIKRCFNWFQILALRIEEIHKIKDVQDHKIKEGEKMNRSNRRRVPVNPAIIFEKTDIDHYDKTSIFDLIRFFRNCHTHYWEDSQDVHYAFGDHFSGFWKFFSKRYPKLFMHVYRKIMPDMPDSEAFVNHTRLYLPILPIEPTCT